jgi:hypothetical protein
MKVFFVEFFGKKMILRILLICITAPITLAQSSDNTQLYAEFVFSYSNISDNRVRFSFFPNFYYPAYLLIGRNNPFIIESGLTLRNIGIIVKDSITFKDRSVNIGIPVKFLLPTKSRKFGIGGEISFPIIYLEKTKYRDQKSRNISLFSEYLTTPQISLTTEYIFGSDLRIKASYFITDFYRGTRSAKNGFGRTYNGNSNIFTLSIFLGIVSTNTNPALIRLFNKR